MSPTHNDHLQLHLNWMAQGCWQGPVSPPSGPAGAWLKPVATLGCRYFDGEGQMRDVTTDELCKGKKVVLFAVPGAFTPTCSLKHVPGFVDKADEFKTKVRDGVQSSVGSKDGNARRHMWRVKLMQLREAP